ncbi:MAG: serine hydrolase [Saprospiraceae bacterium]|nr:serine hydrolase [Saprospiraceae bacterium]
MNFKNIFLLTFFLFINTFNYAQEPATFVEELHDYLHELEEQGDFNLNILLAKDGTVLIEEAFGIANRNDNIPNQLDTRFNIASIGKLFTATAIIKLQEEGQLDLNNLVGDYLPDFPNKAIRDSIYIYQLLCHTSGLNVFFSPEFVTGAKYQYRQLDDYLPLFENLKLEFPPGSQFSYSNPGYIILGLIVEAVTGSTYADYVRKHIFRPANMQSTDNYLLNDIIPNAAIGYVRPQSPEDPWRSNAHINMAGTSAGGAYSTVGDLYKFSDALYNGKLMSQLGFYQMLIQGSDRPGNEQYGYGLSIEKINGHYILGHTGGFYGVRGELLIYEDLGYTLVLLANTDQTDYIDVSYFVKTMLTATEAEKINYQGTQKLIKQFYELGLDKTEIPKSFEADPVLLEIKAYHFLNQGAVSKGIELLQLSAYCFPEDPASYINLANAYLKTGNKTSAILELEKGLLIAPDNAEIINQLEGLKE